MIVDTTDNLIDSVVVRVQAIREDGAGILSRFRAFIAKSERRRAYLPHLISESQSTILNGMV
jgi:hypothetical protein